MSSPQLTDANTSSEWFRTVAQPGASEKARSPSHATITTSARPKRFVRLVTYTMGGLVAFTLLGVASFAIRKSSMQEALDAPASPPLAVVAPDARDTRVAAASPPATPAEVPPPTNAEVDDAPPPPPVAVNKTALPTTTRSKTTKVTKKPVKRSPFLGSR
jgi:hypothetical protein